jgi:hypothetical protein
MASEATHRSRLPDCSRSCSGTAVSILNARTMGCFVAALLAMTMNLARREQTAIQGQTATIFNATASAASMPSTPAERMPPA